MGGMTLASMVSGNTVVLKPSGDSPTIAAKFFEVLEEAGNAGRRSQFLSRITARVSATPSWSTRRHATSHSRARAMWVWRFMERAAKETQKAQIWIKRTILEMGGKDSILVCADADLDAAVDGVVASAFGFSGQKCSACSRAIVEAPIYDVFVEQSPREGSEADRGFEVRADAFRGPRLRADAVGEEEAGHARRRFEFAGPGGRGERGRRSHRLQPRESKRDAESAQQRPTSDRSRKSAHSLLPEMGWSRRYWNGMLSTIAAIKVRLLAPSASTLAKISLTIAAS